MLILHFAIKQNSFNTVNDSRVCLVVQGHAQFHFLVCRIRKFQFVLLSKIDLVGHKKNVSEVLANGRKQKSTFTSSGPELPKKLSTLRMCDADFFFVHFVSPSILSSCKLHSSHIAKHLL